MTNNFPSNHGNDGLRVPPKRAPPKRAPEESQKELQRHSACIMEDHSRPQFGFHCQEQHNQSLLLKLGVNVNVMVDQPDLSAII